MQRSAGAKLEVGQEAGGTVSPSANAEGEDQERFHGHWLDLREPADRQAREASQPLIHRLLQYLAGRPVVRGLDLGSGTGANVRHLAPELSPETTTQQWFLVDHDTENLESARARCRAGLLLPGSELQISTCVADLQNWSTFMPNTGCDLFTASALLDLAGEAWLRSLTTQMAACQAAGLFALSYDGHIRWSPADPFDRTVCAAINAHQRRNKGLGGPALGPDAIPVWTEICAEYGYRLWQMETPWDLGKESLPLVQALLHGWVQAASQQHPEWAAAFAAWGEFRLQSVMAGQARVRVGHTDTLALPAH
jgi:SAM-dependent methyltransferase